MKNLIKIALFGTGFILAMCSTALGYGKQKVVYHIIGDNPQQNKLWYAQIFLLLCELETFTELLKALQAM